MKKTIIKILVFIATFVLTLFAGVQIMNRGHDNMTMEIAQAAFPVITMKLNDVEYNRLYGYREPMDTAFQRDTVTVLGKSREGGFVIDTYGREITGISLQTRSMDGSRLIEDTPLTDFYQAGERVYAGFALKDLLEKDTDYVLTIVLTLEESEQLYYYTRIVWSEELYTEEKLEFVQDFHERLYDKTAAGEITKYLETNSQLEDNSSFHKVNIHSSFKQITWGDLPVSEVKAPVITLKDITVQTGAVVLDYFVSVEEDEDETAYYQVQEYYRVRYTTDRMYLLDYERTMTQIPDESKMYANDKILLGITDTDVPMMESEDGNIVVFEVARRLFSYNVSTNKLAVIFSFYDKDNADARTLHQEHEIKILDVDEGGNVSFAVYGYMNRGRHEGEVGLQVYNYDSTLNTIEEIVYMPYGKTFAVLREEMEQLLYLNREQQLYFALENTVYNVNLLDKTYQKLFVMTQDESVQVSDNHRILVWQEGEDIYGCHTLNIWNLHTGTQNVITVQEGEAIRPLGFMGEDVIYGVAEKDEIVRENSGRFFFPMYKICICDSTGELLKEYSQENVFVTDCSVEANQITLQRVKKTQTGGYAELEADHIMNNVEKETGKNILMAADIEVYERYVQIQTRVTIDKDSIKILTPKEVVFEGGRELTLEEESGLSRYYVYGPYGVEAIYTMPGKAVTLAYENAGIVVSDTGECIWQKGNRVTRNQIMAITAQAASADNSSLAVCLNTILQFEGVTQETEPLLQQGRTVAEILEESIPDTQAWDLSGCNLDAVLYYVNQDIPVLGILNNGDAVLVTGFNEFNVVIMDPVSNTLEKRGMKDTAQWFEENGNHFITYSRGE